MKSIMLCARGKNRMHVDSDDNATFKFLISEHIFGDECTQERDLHASISLNRISAAKLIKFLISELERTAK